MPIRSVPVRETARRRECLGRGSVEPEPPATGDHFGVVIAGTARFFVWMKRLIGSLMVNHPAPVVVYDLGLGSGERSLLLERGVRVCGVPPLVPHAHTTSAWKPWVLLSSPFRYTLYLDANVLVLRPIGEIEDIVRRGEFFVCRDREYSVAQQCGPQTAAFYGVPYDALRNTPAFHAGVIGLDADAYASFLCRWMDGCFDPRLVYEHEVHQDQGIANVAYYAVHGEPPAMRAPGEYNSMGALDPYAVVVNVMAKRWSLPGEWLERCACFERAFDDKQL